MDGTEGIEGDHRHIRRGHADDEDGEGMLTGYDISKSFGALEAVARILRCADGDDRRKTFMSEMCWKHPTTDEWKAIADEIEDAMGAEFPIGDPETPGKCPFCGFDSPEVRIIKGRDGWRDRYSVLCNYSEGGCGAEGGMYHTKAEAIAAWNNRA